MGMYDVKGILWWHNSPARLLSIGMRSVGLLAMGR